MFKHHIKILTVALIAFSAATGCTFKKRADSQNKGANTGVLQVGANANAIVHMFDMPFAYIEAELPILAQAGFGVIQISPPQLSNGGPWWGRYQPLDYRIIDSPLGNEAQLRQLVKAAAAHGIRINADLVLNHMANLGPGHDVHYPPQDAQKKYNVGGLFSPADFHSPFCIVNYGNLAEVKNGRLCGGGSDTGLPDLRQDSDWVLSQQRAFIAKLNEIGIAGYRIDAVKHMEIDYFNKLLTPDLVKGKHVYGEVIAFQSTFDSDLEPYLRGTSMGFMDFPLQETIRNAFKPEGSLAALVEPVGSKAGLAGDRAVTFVVNHDIPNNDGFRYMIMNESDETLGYAYIMGRADGVPHFFSDRGVEGGLREDRWKNAHRRKDIAAMLAFHNATHGASQKILWTDACVLVIERDNKGLMGINKCGHKFSATVATKLKGSAVEVLTGAKANIGDKLEFTIPARSAVMFLP